MRKYIKPELEVNSFKVEADVMVDPIAAPTPTVGVVANVISTGNMYISDDVSNKAWTSVDGEDWAWSE